MLTVIRELAEEAERRVGEPEPPGYAPAGEDPAVPGQGEPVGQGDPLVPYSWHPEEADAPHEDPGAPHEEAEVVDAEAEVAHAEPEAPYDEAEVVDPEPDGVHEDPAPPPAGGHDDTAVKPPDEAYREAAAQQPTEYFTPPDVQEESRGRRLRRLFSRKSDR